MPPRPVPSARRPAARFTLRRPAAGLALCGGAARFAPRRAAAGLAPPRPAVGLAPRRAGTRSGSVAGQASVELVAVLPVIVLLLALAWQLALVGQAAWTAHAAARAAARAHAVGGDELRAARAVVPRELDRRLSLAKADDDRVGVRLRVPIVLPGFRDTSITARSAFAEQR